VFEVFFVFKVRFLQMPDKEQMSLSLNRRKTERLYSVIRKNELVVGMSFFVSLF